MATRYSIAEARANLPTIVDEVEAGQAIEHQLIYQCHRLPRGKPRAARETYLQEVMLASFPVLAFDETAANWHGQERARLEDLRRTVPFVDGQIASIARVNELVLVTANVKDFTLFKEVEVVNWSKRRF